MSHESQSGHCVKCDEIINKYPGINPDLLSWFKWAQSLHPELHASCAGRGKVDQEECFLKKTSRAHYGQSAHNYNCGLDLFFIVPGKEIYDRELFNELIPKIMVDDLVWYGAPGSVFFELPHVEVRNWRALVASGECELVEQL